MKLWDTNNYGVRLLSQLDHLPSCNTLCMSVYAPKGENTHTVSHAAKWQEATHLPLASNLGFFEHLAAAQHVWCQSIHAGLDGASAGLGSREGMTIQQKGSL